ncbi:MAG TPA: zf-HC2 domain-containing protein [Pyrinomonadaceae bacterium]|nr:zf-HC2 domain-containing protein [Pyrinomonadaceae bacterium]
MRERTEICARSEDLVAYLYGEASQTDARDFERHTQHCAACRTELAAFGNVREAIGEWRHQALGTIVSTAFENNNVTAFVSTKEPSRPKRSALAAIREFFTLSPLWMRAATAAIALIFCALAFIAIAHFKEQPNVVAINEPGKSSTTQGSNNTNVAKTSDQSNPQNVNEITGPPQKETVANNRPQAPRPVKSSSAGLQQQQLAKRPRKQILPRNLNDSEELAENNDYLPFTAPSHEDKLPSLADLAEPNQ